jgi:hypothetical protein
MALLSLCCTGCEDGCKRKKDVKPVYAAWSVEGSSYEANSSNFYNNTLESSCEGNNKLFVLFGTAPTTTAPLKVVNYDKATLAADEVKIDIAHGDNDFLTTGTGNTVIYPEIMSNGKARISFQKTRFRKININTGTSGSDSVIISGFIVQM